MRLRKAISIYQLIADVGAPSVTPQGTGGSTSWGYSVVGVDANGNKTAVSTEGTTAAGNATLDGTNFNRVEWTDVAGIVTYEIHRTTAGGTPGTTGLIGTVGSGVELFDDTGLAVSDATAPNATNTTGDGPSVNVDEFGGNAIEVYVWSIGTGDYQVQRSADGSHWINNGSALSADGSVSVSVPCSLVRIQNTAYTSGTPSAMMIGGAD